MISFVQQVELAYFSGTLLGPHVRDERHVIARILMPSVIPCCVFTVDLFGASMTSSGTRGQPLRCISDENNVNPKIKPIKTQSSNGTFGDFPTLETIVTHVHGGNTRALKCKAE
jgi:hypothetical protein